MSYKYFNKDIKEEKAKEIINRIENDGTLLYYGNCIDNKGMTHMYYAYFEVYRTYFIVIDLVTFDVYLFDNDDFSSNYNIATHISGEQGKAEESKQDDLEKNKRFDDVYIEDYLNWLISISQYLAREFIFDEFKGE